MSKPVLSSFRQAGNAIVAIFFFFPCNDLAHFSFCRPLITRKKKKAKRRELCVPRSLFLLPVRRRCLEINCMVCVGFARRGRERWQCRVSLTQLKMSFFLALASGCLTQLLKNSILSSTAPIYALLG